MKARFIQRAESVDFRPSKNIEAGEFVRLGNLVGVTKCQIPANTLGTLFLSGIFDVQKPDSIQFQPGECVYSSQSGIIGRTGTLLGLALPNPAPGCVRILLNCSAEAAAMNSPELDAEWLPL